jgi:transglutaminase-like putative cysteine protease
LIYPAFLKNPVFIKPDIPGALSRVNGNSINFYKDDLGKSGISIAFGDSQIYDFDLDYDLKDQNLFPISTEIALPPNTNYQNIIINSINPQPDNVKVDEDGNWLAQYKLLPSQRLKINVKGKAKVFLNGSSENITSENIAQYLKSEPYWETNAQNITDTAKSLKTPEDIYQYVVGKLSYDYNRTSSAQSRLGASATLNNPQLAVCLEFSDLFIALSRKIGIPAREVEGFAYTKNSQERPLSLVEDVLHAWPEYYDTQKQSWIMVDPTWGNTTGGVDYFNTFDFDHLAFVVKGISSTYPVPAGGYKLTGDENKKDVNVTLSKTFNENPQFSIFANIADSFLPFLPIDGEVVIKNTGNSMLKPAEVDMQTNYLKLNVQSKVLPAIPPFGSVSIPIKLRGPVLTKTNDTITIRYLGKTFEKSVKITPFYLNVWILGGIISVIFIIILSIIAGRIRRLSVSRQ